MAGFLDQLKGLNKSFSLGGLFQQKSTSAIGVDIGTSSIKVVQLRRDRGVAVLETYGELALGPYAELEIGQATNLSPERIGEALRDIMKEANVTTTNAGVAIPFSSSLLTLIELPNLARNELSHIIPLEARKYIPVPIGEVALDWFILPDQESRTVHRGDTQAANPSEKIKILLVAIHNSALEKYQSIVRAAGLQTTFFEIEIFSTIRAVMEQTVAPIAILDIGASTSKLYIVEYGIVQTSHIIPRGSQDITRSLALSMNVSITRAEEIKREQGLAAGGDPKQSDTMMLTLGYIFSESHRVILNYEKKHNRNVATMLLTGGGSALRNIETYAKKHFDAQVVTGKPFEKTDTPAFIADVLKDAGPTFSVAVGLALRKLQEG
jgi:type IV pilus assembly protein PilM